MELRDSIHLEQTVDGLLGLPTAVSPDASGYLVVDAQQPHVFRFDESGRFVQRYGREGNGPGEFKEAAAAVPYGSDQILVFSWSPPWCIVATSCCPLPTRKRPFASLRSGLPLGRIGTFNSGPYVYRRRSDQLGRTVNLDDLAQKLWAQLNDLAIRPLARFLLGLDQSDRTVLYVLVAAAVVLGFAFGRRRKSRTSERRRFGAWRFPGFQNRGEALVSRVLLSHFGAPDYHLMNHVTLRMHDGTTQVDHILVSRFGVFVIETKDFTGWIFANATEATWTQVLFHWRFTFQNPIRQNYRHVRAVQDLLDFLPPAAIKSVVVFTGDAEFKTDTPQGVTMLGQLAEYLKQHTVEVMSLNRQQFCVGRLETARLAISHKTDVEHVHSLARRHGSAT